MNEKELAAADLYNEYMKKVTSSRAGRQELADLISNSSILTSGYLKIDREELDKDIEFMRECRERTTNEKKCEHCELRFKCYTEPWKEEEDDDGKIGEITYDEWHKKLNKYKNGSWKEIGKHRFRKL